MAVAQVCCVDNERPGTHTLGGRWFCEEHYKKATYHRKGVWRSGVILIVGLAIFVAAVVAVDQLVKPQLAGVVLVLVGLVLALVPAVVWQVFFYIQDQLEPEPVGDVVKMFVIGLALAGAIGLPLTNQLFAVQTWIYRSPLTTWLASIFINGAVEAFTVYATVRYFMFDEPEFDERTDGVIYCTAAALGYATAFNLQFILSNGGAALGSTEIFVTAVAMAHAAFGGLMGYFLGRAKLEHDPIWWLPLGLTLTALLNGLFLIVRGTVVTSTLQFAGPGPALPSFNGLILAGALALVVTVLVSYLIRRDIDRSLEDKQPPVIHDPVVRKREANYATIGVFAVMLVIGGLAWSGAENQSTAFNVSGIQGSYPAYYSVATQPGDVLRVADTFGTGSEFVISTTALTAGQDATAVADQLAGTRSTSFNLYKVLSTGHAPVGGQTALTQRFAYVDANGLTGAVPQVHQGIDYIFVDSNGKATVVTLVSTPDELPTVQPLFANFLNSLKF